MSSTPPWASQSGGSTFTPPRDTTTANPPRTPSRTGNRVVTALLSALVVLLVSGAVALVLVALVPEDVSAPVPESEFDVGLQEPVGATGVDPTPMDDGTQMTVEDMEPNTMFIPALGVYMPVQSDSTFVSSRYSDFDTLKVPSNARKAAHYAAGAPLVGGETGTTLVAAHVSTSSGWGALRYLYTLKGGEMIYTKGADGSVQEWQVTKMRVEKHTDFPQEYWSAEGERQLVVTTCGGPMTRDRNFLENIFAIATPLTPEPAPTDDATEATDNSTGEES